MRSTGASASKGSQAAPDWVMAICATSRSGPRAIHRPTTSPGPMPRWARPRGDPRRRGRRPRHRSGAGDAAGLARAPSMRPDGRAAARAVAGRSRPAPRRGSGPGGPAAQDGAVGCGRPAAPAAPGRVISARLLIRCSAAGSLVSRFPSYPHAPDPPAIGRVPDAGSCRYRGSPPTGGTRANRPHVRVYTLPLNGSEWTPCKSHAQRQPAASTTEHAPWRTAMRGAALRRDGRARPASPGRRRRGRPPRWTAPRSAKTGATRSVSIA